MSEEPKIAGLSPMKIALEAGKKYAFCTCGHSEAQPFCDGRHKGSSFSPNVFIVENSEDVWMCLCKQLQTGHKCDGSHKPLREANPQ
ncbi:MAG: CDGSH iron-sulfur domain-containing protein [Planctomycetaceae bacterium]|nr:CDGSH iron-sulfur domain-containing protein [Planctomycetaceae bacterium]